MASITASDFRNGKTVEFEGNIYVVIEFMHVKPGKGAAFVRTKLKNIKTGGVVEKSFRPTEKFEEAHIERKEMQYSYSDGDFFYFMDPETFDMLPVAADFAADSMKFVKENDLVKVSSHAGSVFAIDPPIEARLLVTQCDPGVKGNTTTNATKPCTVETGARVMVPLFINEGEYIIVDPATGDYKSRG